MSWRTASELCCTSVNTWTMCAQPRSCIPPFFLFSLLVFCVAKCRKCMLSEIQAHLGCIGLQPTQRGACLPAPSLLANTHFHSISFLALLHPSIAPTLPSSPHHSQPHPDPIRFLPPGHWFSSTTHRSPLDIKQGPSRLVSTALQHFTLFFFLSSEHALRTLSSASSRHFFHHC